MDDHGMTEMIKNKISLKNSLKKSIKFMEFQKILTKMPIMICKRKEEYPQPPLYKTKQSKH